MKASTMWEMKNEEIEIENNREDEIEKEREIEEDKRDWETIKHE